jgi:hypothetical protein
MISAGRSPRGVLDKKNVPKPVMSDGKSIKKKTLSLSLVWDTPLSGVIYGLRK